MQRTSTSLTLSILGGYLPDGRFLDPSDTPRFAPGGRYLVVLRADNTHLSPVLDDFVFSIEQEQEEEIAVGPSGRPVLAVSVMGVQFAEEAAFSPTRFDAGSERFARAARLVDARVSLEGPSRVLRAREVAAALVAEGRRQSGAYSRDFPGQQPPPWGGKWSETPTIVGGPL